MEDHLTINGIDYIRKDLRDSPPERGTVWRNNMTGLHVMVVNLRGEETPGRDYGICQMTGPSQGSVWNMGIRWPQFFREHTQVEGL